MKINIYDQRKIFNIQEDFHTAFPYLKIEFFSRPHKIGGSLSKKLLKYPEKTLGECRIPHKKDSIVITPQMSVADLEQNFSRIYGLSVQIFRKSGKAWLETSVTDDWTLEQQNDHGKELSEWKEKELDKDEAAE